MTQRQFDKKTDELFARLRKKAELIRKRLELMEMLRRHSDRVTVQDVPVVGHWRPRRYVEPHTRHIIREIKPVKLKVAA